MLLTLIWAALALVLVGLGSPVLRLLGRRAARTADLEPAFWLGLAVAVAALQLWHFLAPIDTPAAALLTAAGLVGLLAGRSALRGAWSDVRALHPLLLAGWGLVVLLCAVWALAPLQWYDAGLYQVQAVKWAISYPVVPGLGNLHSRLAYNSSFFLYLALLRVVGGDGWYYHVGNGVLVLALLTAMASSIVAAARRKSLSRTALFDAVLVAPVLGLIGRLGLSTTANDLPVLVVQVLVAREVVAMLDAASPRERGFSLAYVSILSVLGTALKLSFVFYGAAALGAALLLAARGGGTRGRLRGAAVVAGPALLLGVPWLLSGVVLSGYPLFPSTALGAPVDWRIPPAEAQLEGADILAFARAPVSYPPKPDELAAYERAGEGWAWLGPWATRNWQEFGPPLAVAALGMAAALRRRRDRAVLAGAAALVVPAWAAITAWFVAAPEPRFVGALFWIAAAGAVAGAAPTGRGRLAVLALAAVAFLVTPQARDATKPLRTPLAMLRGRVVPAGPPAPGPLRPVTTASGLVVYVPAAGQQTWDGPLLSTPTRVDPELRLRCPPDLSCGFSKRPARS
jgi:MYXO-CTERM domain-containing protein